MLRLIIDYASVIQKNPRTESLRKLGLALEQIQEATPGLQISVVNATCLSGIYDLAAVSTHVADAFSNKIDVYQRGYFSSANGAPLSDLVGETLKRPIDTLFLCMNNTWRLYYSSAQRPNQKVFFEQHADEETLLLKLIEFICRTDDIGPIKIVENSFAKLIEMKNSPAGEIDQFPGHIVQPILTYIKKQLNIEFYENLLDRYLQIYASTYNFNKDAYLTELFCTPINLSSIFPAQLTKHQLFNMPEKLFHTYLAFHGFCIYFHYRTQVCHMLIAHGYKTQDISNKSMQDYLNKNTAKTLAFQQAASKLTNEFHQALGDFKPNNQSELELYDKLFSYLCYMLKNIKIFFGNPKTGAEDWLVLFTNVPDAATKRHYPVPASISAVEENQLPIAAAAASSDITRSTLTSVLQIPSANIQNIISSIQAFIANDEIWGKVHGMGVFSKRCIPVGISTMREILRNEKDDATILTQLKSTANAALERQPKGHMALKARFYAQVAQCSSLAEINDWLIENCSTRHPNTSTLRMSSLEH